MDIHDQLLAALREFEAAVTAAREGAGADFRTHFRRLDALAAQLPADTDPQVRHFLAQKSYPQARARLTALRLV